MKTRVSLKYFVTGCRLRWNNSSETDRKFLRGGEIKQKSLHEYFLRDVHQGFEEDDSFCLIGKTDLSGLHKTQYYCVRTLKTIASFGLHTKETYWEAYTIKCFSSVLLIYIFAESMQICLYHCQFIVLFYFFALQMLLVMSKT